MSEEAYDGGSAVEEFTHPCNKALDETNAEGWMVVDMKRDWNRIFPFDK